MWRVVSIDEGQCLDVPVPEYGSVIAPNSGKWQIEVRVLAANVDEAQRLLRELQVADYGDAKVDITVHLPDEHGPDVSAVTSKAYSHGALRVVVGKMEKPADIWVPGSETGPRLVAIATGKAQIAPSWHRTLLQLLARYAGDSYRDFDPRVFGFGLGTHDGYTAPANKGVYRYQRFAPLSVVFPWHWTRFVRAGPIFDPDLEETVARWIAVNGYYAIHAPGEDQGPSIAKLPSFDAFGRETKNPDALVSRSWWFETDAKEADDVIQRTAAPPSGSKRGKEPKPPKPPRGRKGKGGKGKGKGKKRE